MQQFMRIQTQRVRYLCLQRSWIITVSIEEKSMEGIEGESSGAGRFTLPPMRISNEDIIFCVDVDAESLVEMKSTGFNGKPITRLDAMKQAILLFVNSKLSINPDHRFAFVTLAKTASWVLSLFPLFIFQLKFWTTCRTSVGPAILVINWKKK